MKHLRYVVMGLSHDRKHLQGASLPAPEREDDQVPPYGQTMRRLYDVVRAMEIEPLVEGLLDGLTPAPRTFDPCPKCGSDQLAVLYHDGRAHCSSCRQITSCRFSSGCGENGRLGEHLVVRCERCRYTRQEAVSS